MNNRNKKQLIQTLQTSIKETDELFQSGKSLAYLVGYLQGIIKQTIDVLEMDKSS